MSETNRRITRELSLALEATENSSDPLSTRCTRSASGSQALAVVRHLRRRRSVANAARSPETASKAVATTSSCLPLSPSASTFSSLPVPAESCTSRTADALAEVSTRTDPPSFAKAKACPAALTGMKTSELFQRATSFHSVVSLASSLTQG